MTRPINPQHMMRELTPSHLKWAQSIYNTLAGGIQITNPTGKDASGVYNKFQSANTSGTFVRIGSSSSSEPVKWTGNGVGVVIKHGLGYQPVGFQVVDQDKTVNVWRTVPPDAVQITLAPSDATANVTVHIF